jgi:hypothetical protein
MWQAEQMHILFDLPNHAVCGYYFHSHFTDEETVNYSG